ncbi:MAG TPA: POTRA domain-containing protein [Bacteroidia bacterium]
MNKPLLHILFFCLLALSIKAQKKHYDDKKEQKKIILSVNVTDNQSFIKNLKIKPSYDTKEDAQEEVNNIVSSFRSSGYLLADVDSLSFDSVSCKATMHSGTKFKWAHLYKGNLDDDALASSGFNERMYANLVFTPHEVSKLLDRILIYYENNGYPFARVKLDSVLIQDNAISAKISVTKHRVVTIDSVVIIGNANIHKKYLYRYLHIKQGSLYDEQQIKQVEKRIKQLPFIAQKQQQVVKITDKVTKLILFLDKKNSNQTDGIVGLQPTPNGKTVLTGNVNLKLYNSIFRSGELFSLNWQRLQYQTQDFKTNIVYPYLFNTPLGVDYALTIYKRDTTYINIQNNIGVQYLFSGLNYFKVFFKQNTSNLLSTSGLIGASVLPDYANVSVNSYGVSFFYEKLNYRFNPRSGISIHITVSAGTRQVKKNTQLSDDLYHGVKLYSTQYQAEGMAAYYLPIFKYSCIKMALQGGTINSPQLFTNELYRIGGLKSMPGINEQSIYASSYGIANLEYHFLFEQNSAFLLFGNYGWFQNASYNFSTSNPTIPNHDMPYSFGAGVLFQTKAGIFQMNYAIGHQYDNQISLRAGKINFGLINTF